MKKIVGIIFISTVLALAGCTQDNVHMPEQEIQYIYVGDTTQNDFPRTLEWSGSLTTSVPQLGAMFTPATTPNTLKFTDRTGEKTGYTTLILGAFDIDVPATHMHFAFGEMQIDSVQYATYPSGNGMFYRDNFQVQSGQYLTKGSLKGTYGADGTVEMTISYKPGTMPFEIISQFQN